MFQHSKVRISNVPQHTKYEMNELDVAYSFFVGDINMQCPYDFEPHTIWVLTKSRFEIKGSVTFSFKFECYEGAR